MGPTRTRRLLHRIGYAATLIVALEIGYVGWIAGSAWWRNRQVETAHREDTRTHAGLITAQNGDPVRENALKLLAKLPPPASLSPDGVRYMIAPSFGRQWFAIALRPNRINAVGTLISVGNFDQDTFGAEKRRVFTIPIQAYRTLMTQADQLTDGWAGTPEFVLDGTVIAFERIRGKDLSSGIGNEPHYARLAATVRDGLAPYVPEVADLDREWMQHDHRPRR